jgi:hypothetical protein
MFDLVYHRQTSISDSPLRIRSHATLLVTSLPLPLFLVFQCRTSLFHFLPQKTTVKAVGFCLTASHHDMGVEMLEIF